MLDSTITAEVAGYFMANGIIVFLQSVEAKDTSQSSKQK